MEAVGDGAAREHPARHLSSCLYVDEAGQQSSTHRLSQLFGRVVHQHRQLRCHDPAEPGVAANLWAVFLAVGLLVADLVAVFFAADFAGAARFFAVDFADKAALADASFLVDVPEAVRSASRHKDLTVSS